MSTPAATRLASVREKRAIVTFKTTSPTFIGIRSLRRSQIRRPFSLRFHRRIAKTPITAPGKMMYQAARSAFEAWTTICVSIGSWPPSCV